jgi:hypothetical protein
MFGFTTWDKMTTEGQEDLAQAALKCPDSFGYRGELPLFESWSLGPTIEHRDSGVLDRANAQVLRQALEAEERFEGAYEEINCSHWGHGWTTHLCFEVKTDEGEIHPIVGWLNDWYAALADYPVADDAVFSEMEYQASLEDLEGLGAGEHASEVFGWLWSHREHRVYHDGESIAATEEDVEDALKALGLFDE